MDEIWKPIDGFEENYEVSNLGRVKSLPKTGMFVSGRYACVRFLGGRSKNKYLQVQLWKEGKCKAPGVHTLVLQAFKPTKRKGVQCNHKDGNPHNNRVDNLEWNTPKENIHHAFRTGLCNHRRGEKLYNAKLTEKDVIWIRDNIKQSTYQKISEMFNVTKGCIYHIITRRNWKHI